MRLNDIIKSMHEFAAEYGNTPSVFYISSVDADGFELCEDMSQQILYGTGNLISSYANDRALVVAGLQICGVPIKIADIVQ